jgi:hypothetical protein
VFRSESVVNIEYNGFALDSITSTYRGVLLASTSNTTSSVEVDHGLHFLVFFQYFFNVNNAGLGYSFFMERRSSNLNRIFTKLMCCRHLI